MLQIVANTMATHHMLKNCKHLIVGISGGADSVCLLSILLAYIKKQQLPITLHAAHVNHCLRGDAADADEAQVKALCAMWKIPLKVKRCNVAELAKEQGISEEMAGREVRYAFFQELSEKLPDCKIAVAHNKDDRAETVLWNVIRGTGTEGLKGIPYVRGNIIRPLLDVSKDAIRQYCRENNFPVCEDGSNQDTVYNRNKIRLALMPYMQELFGTNMTEKIIRMSDNVACDDAFLQEAAEMAKSICVKEDGAIDVAMFLQQHVAIQIRLLQQCCNHQLQQVHLQGLLSFLKQNQTGKQLALPGNLIARLQYGLLYIQKQSAEISCTESQLQICYEVLPATEQIKPVSNTALEQMYDYDLLLAQCEYDVNRICIRTRQEGDYIRPLRGRGRKSLKKFFIDKKIPRDERETMSLFVMGQEVLWIPGVCRCDGYLPTKETKRVLRVYTKFIYN